ncbi:hypothetical protein [Clostridium tetani]|uniref:hypothetical protein n=1 Tax=Clostridium tetani TaxID=1513 RepID=UPI0010286D97|nr:hypothetical protein [Clostridium tetani]RXI74949.1 hypothetical protein DP127_01445 [Clostridium tetani]BDR74647.1 hypothetical protein K154306013_03070 [Clostridium tetani]
MDQTKSYVFRIVRDSKELDITKHEIESTTIGTLEGTTLKDIPAGTTVGELKKALTVSAGAEIHLVNKNTKDEITGDSVVLTDEMEIVVVAKGGTSGYYTILIKA